MLTFFLKILVSVAVQFNQDSTICVGGSIPDLQVDPDGPGSITWEWNLVGWNSNHVVIGSAPDSTTNIFYPAPTSGAGTFEYICEVTFSAGGCSTATSSSIIVTNFYIFLSIYLFIITLFLYWWITKYNRILKI